MSCSPRLLSCVLYMSVALLAAPLIAFEPAEQAVEDDSQKQAAQERKEMFTNWMRGFAEKTKIVDTRPGREDQPARLVPHPVFRYSDEQRFIPDATLWVWTVDGRPAALQKVEGNNQGGSQWTICFASLSEDLVKVTWPVGREFQAQKPGVRFKPIPNAESPSDNPRSRTRQMKALKDRFGGRLGPGANQGGGAATRFMAKPIFEYDEPDSTLPQGAIFGMSATGTNPDLLLLIEARRDGEGKLRWEYAWARMTAEPLVVRLDKAEVWSESSSGANNIAPGNWIYFFLPRSFE